MPKWIWPSMILHRMFFVLTSTLPPFVDPKLTKHGRCCMQNNQLPIERLVTLKDSSYDKWRCLQLSLSLIGLNFPLKDWRFWMLLMPTLPSAGATLAMIPKWRWLKWNLHPYILCQATVDKEIRDESLNSKRWRHHHLFDGLHLGMLCREVFSSCCQCPS